MGYTLSFEMPSLPKTTNAMTSMHWTQKKRMVKEIHDTIAYITLAKRPKKPLKQAKISCERHSSVRPDYDGLVSSFKHVIDALITSQIIEDDNLDVIGVPEFKWIKAKPTEGFIVVSVKEL